ncbi:MAG TPA: acyl-CoA dehydrogenase family protein [Polyangiales bacterium]|nr:acyl-CoA dehydrogenase family protein [Polyangiales bacterium]
MIEWSETHLAFRDMVRRFIDAEVKPALEAIEHQGEPPYAVIRKMITTFGLGELATAELRASLDREQRAEEAAPKRRGPSPEAAERVALQAILVTELCRYSLGIVTAWGVSVGLTAGAIMSRGTRAQKERFVPALLSMQNIGAWAITEPDSGSDAFGSMKASARRDGDHYILNGSKTFITNGPYADTIIFICKLDDGRPQAERRVVSFILDRDTPGLTASKPLRKMGLHGSPTGQLFLDDVRVTRDRLLGETEEAPASAGAKDTFTAERTGVAAMALGIIAECQQLSLEYSQRRIQFGKPISQFQLIQLKLANMEVARMNVQNLVFRQIELAAAGRRIDLAEASACKLYSAQAAMQCALEAVQLFGGNGYMAEYRVEQLCRDAKVLQIYAGTDEIQVSQIARSLLARHAVT